MAAPKRAVDRIRVGHVGGNGQRERAVASCLRDGLGERLGPAAGEDDRIPFAQERQGRRPADA